MQTHCGVTAACGCGLRHDGKRVRQTTSGKMEQKCNIRQGVESTASPETPDEPALAVRDLPTRLTIIVCCAVRSVVFTPCLAQAQSPLLGVFLRQRLVWNTHTNNHLRAKTPQSSFAIPVRVQGLT